METFQDYSDALYEYSVGGRSSENSKVSPWVMVASHKLRRMNRPLRKPPINPQTSVDFDGIS